MGLGKSLTAITTLHTAMTSSSMKSQAPNVQLVRTALCIVPANTLVNWQNEVQKWTQDLRTPLKYFQLGGVMPGYRSHEIQRWKRDGGLLLLGDGMFLKLASEILKTAQPDVLFLDEAHTMLKNDRTQTFLKLKQIKTKRIILTTGTPLQNNLTEYYHMCEFMRPGVLGAKSVKEFEDLYRYVTSEWNDAHFSLLARSPLHHCTNFTFAMAGDLSNLVSQVILLRSRN